MSRREPYAAHLGSNSSSPTASMTLLQTRGSYRSSATNSDSRFDFGAYPSLNSVSEKYNLPPDPRLWGSNLSRDVDEPDDNMHNPDRPEESWDFTHLSPRGVGNVSCLLILILGLLALFIGYPVITFVTRVEQSTQGAFNLGGVNASGQVPDIGNFRPIDNDTPKEAYMRNSPYDGRELQLVFSDEFNQDVSTLEMILIGKPLTFIISTNNLEWYDPAQITTKGGALEITLAQKNPADNHNLSWAGGMMSTWNKFCFTGGYIEASVTLPNTNNIQGLWPAVWFMGNLGRAGYGASLEGMWPYSYDECDLGTLANQTLNGLPLAATVGGDEAANGEMSYLPGQRLSRCTCEGENHPGPKHSDGTYVGRSAPEIDIFEAQVSKDAITDEMAGFVSQSGQFAPFDAGFYWKNTSDVAIIADPTQSEINSFKGNAFQESTSVVTRTNQQCYELTGGCFATYGVEYKPGFDDAYISWVNDDKLAWTLLAGAVGANPLTEISRRAIPYEPMYAIMNLGMSRNFGNVDLDHLVFPTTMRVDWIRIYQDPSALNVGCDPKEYPTAAYIEAFNDAYTNPNLTTWVDDYKQVIPKNKLIDQC